MLEKLLSANLHDMLILVMPFAIVCALMPLNLWADTLPARLKWRVIIAEVLWVLAGLAYWLR